jgi:hypothetical protein
MQILKSIGRKRAGQLTLLVLTDIVFFGATNAHKANTYTMIIGFGLLMATAYAIIYGLVALSRLYGLPIRNRNKLTVYLTCVMAVLFALQSIGELDPRDILVLVPLSLIAYVYSSYSQANKRQPET